MGPLCSSAETQVCHRSYIIAAISKLKEAETQLKRESIGEDNITAAKEKITEGIHLFCHREKLVKLAYSSQLGWKVVQEYESNPLAEARAKRVKANDPKINRVLPLPQGNHVAKFGKDPIYRTKVIVQKPVWTPARHTQSHNTARLETAV